MMQLLFAISQRPSHGDISYSERLVSITDLLTVRHYFLRKALVNLFQMTSLNTAVLKEVQWRNSI